MRKPPFVHETAIVEDPCEIGAGTKIMQFACVMAISFIGEQCTISQRVTLNSGVFLGNNVTIMPNAYISSGVILEDGVHLGQSVVFESLRSVHAGRDNVSSLQPGLVKVGATVGPNSTLVTGFSVGKFAFVEPNSVVDKHVPDFAVISGNPFNIIGWRCQCGQLLQFIFQQTSCQACGKRYVQQHSQLVAQL